MKMVIKVIKLMENLIKLMENLIVIFPMESLLKIDDGKPDWAIEIVGQLNWINNRKFKVVLGKSNNSTTFNDIVFAFILVV